MHPNNQRARRNPRTGGWAVVLVGLAALVSAACSDDGGGSSTSSTAVSSPSTSSTAKPGGGGDFCATLKTHLTNVTQRLPKPGTEDQAAQLRAYGTFLEESNAKLLAAAPAELRSAMEIFVRNSNRAATDFKSGATPPATTQSSEEQAASEQITQYAADNCRG